jgi:DNA-binding XRE family transcriptional regulator
MGDFQKAAALPSTPTFRQNKNLAQLREALDLTQEALAETIDVDRRYVQGLEYGDYWPSLPVLSRLKEAFDCDWDDRWKVVKSKNRNDNPVLCNSINFAIIPRSQVALGNASVRATSLPQP